VEKQLDLIPEKEPIDYKPLIVVKTILSVISGREQGSILRTKCDLTIKTKNNHHIDILNRAGYVIGLDATPIWQVLNSVIEQPILEVREEALPLSNLTIRSTITKGLKHSLNLTNKNSLAPRRVDAIIHKRANYDPKIIGFQRLGDLYYWFNHNRACNDLAKSAYLIVKGCPNPNVNNVKADYLTLFGNDDGFDKYYRALRDAEVIQVLGRQRSQNFTENTFTLEFLHEELPLGRIAHQYGCNFEEKNAFEVCTDAGEAWQITRWGIVKAIFNLAFKNEKVSHRAIANLIKETKSTVADHLSSEVIKKNQKNRPKPLPYQALKLFWLVRKFL
jgi:hypothetical protein